LADPALPERRLDGTLPPAEREERVLQLAAERIDLTEVMSRPRRGHAHVVTQAWERLEDVFIGLGFQVAEGPHVETDWYNFTALNMPPDHPARSMHDTFYLEHLEPGSTVLRTHTSSVQIRVMQTLPPPIYMVMPGRVFRTRARANSFTDGATGITLASCCISRSWLGARTCCSAGTVIPVPTKADAPREAPAGCRNPFGNGFASVEVPGRPGMYRLAPPPLAATYGVFTE
jgi:hypothetical protein